MVVALACGMCLRHSSMQRLRKKCLFVHKRTCGRTRPSGNESHLRDTGCKFTSAKGLVRDTLCDGHWKVLTSDPCVAYNETEVSLVPFHGDDFLAEGHDSSLDKLR